MQYIRTYIIRDISKYFKTYTADLHLGRPRAGVEQKIHAKIVGDMIADTEVDIAMIVCSKLAEQIQQIAAGLVVAALVLPVEQADYTDAAVLDLNKTHVVFVLPMVCNSSVD